MKCACTLRIRVGPLPKLRVSKKPPGPEFYDTPMYKANGVILLLFFVLYKYRLTEIRACIVENSNTISENIPREKRVK